MGFCKLNRMTRIHNFEVPSTMTFSVLHSQYLIGIRALIGLTLLLKIGFTISDQLLTYPKFLTMCKAIINEAKAYVATQNQCYVSFYFERTTFSLFSLHDRCFLFFIFLVFFFYEHDGCISLSKLNNLKYDHYIHILLYINLRQLYLLCF